MAHARSGGQLDAPALGPTTSSRRLLALAPIPSRRDHHVAVTPAQRGSCDQLRYSRCRSWDCFQRRGRRDQNVWWNDHPWRAIDGRRNRSAAYGGFDDRGRRISRRISRRTPKRSPRPGSNSMATGNRWHCNQQNRNNDLALHNTFLREGRDWGALRREHSNSTTPPVMCKRNGLFFWTKIRFNVIIVLKKCYSYSGSRK
jgi:hypothetical protein